MIKQYQKKPITISAIQWTGDNFNEVFYNFVGIICGETDKGELVIRTLEGNMVANPGDYIVRGVKGEFYPVKEDIFLETYVQVPCEGREHIMIPSRHILGVDGIFKCEVCGFYKSEL